MKASKLIWIGVVILVLGGGWYWMNGSSSKETDNLQKSITPSVQSSDTQTNMELQGPDQQGVEPVVTVAHNAKLGDYLVAMNGMTLYRYTKDTSGISNCSGTCAENWPPLVHIATDPDIAGERTTGTLALIMRTDGSEQITYNAVPLYFWKNDLKPGDTNGQNVGGVWFVIKP